MIPDDLTFKTYQALSETTAIYPEVCVIYGNHVDHQPELSHAIGWPYVALGLAGEAGEVANKCKKILRDRDGTFSGEDMAAIKEELGDVLWYVSQMANEFGLSLEEVARDNLDKLAGRKQRGTLQGSGGDR